jgi:hypothetical protein
MEHGKVYIQKIEKKTGMDKLGLDKATQEWKIWDRWKMHDVHLPGLSWGVKGSVVCTTVKNIDDKCLTHYETD